MKWICNYAEFDTDRYGIEKEPFSFVADNYEEEEVET